MEQSVSRRSACECVIPTDSECVTFGWLVPAVNNVELVHAHRIEDVTFVRWEAPIAPPALNPHRCAADFAYIIPTPSMSIGAHNACKAGAPSLPRHRSLAALNLLSAHALAPPSATLEPLMIPVQVSASPRHCRCHLRRPADSWYSPKLHLGHYCGGASWRRWQRTDTPPSAVCSLQHATNSHPSTRHNTN